MEETKENEKTNQQVQSEREEPKMKLRGHKGNSLGKVGYIFLSFGIIALASSIIYNSSILAFIGLGLTLWGGLFLFVRPVRYVKVDLLDSTAVSSLIAIDKILTELNYQGKGIYLPPRRLKELKEGIVFIPKKKRIFIPQTKELAKGKTFVNPDGICLTPPGRGLLTLYEKKLGTDLSKTNLNYLRTNLPKLLIEDLELLEDLEIDEHNDRVYVKIRGSIYEGLCTQMKNQTNICSRIGCPLCSSIASALAKATGRAVVTERNEISSDGKTVKTWYRVIKARAHSILKL